MKIFYLTSIILWSTVSFPAWSQVNLDQPISVGQSDKVFHSAADPNVAYYFPIGLNRIGSVKVRDDDDVMTAEFTSSVPSENVDIVRTQLDKAGLKNMQIRFLKPMSFEVVPGTDISTRFEPKITAMSDFDLVGPMPLTLRVNRLSRFFRRAEAYDLFENLFGPSHQDNVAIVQYVVDAIVIGKPALAKTAVGIFAGSKANAPEYHDFLAAEERVEPSTSNSPVEILNDKVSGCWDDIKPGQFCTREK